MLFCILACWESVVKCYEQAVKKSGQQFKAVSPVKCPAQFRRQLKGQERLPARDWFEAMPVEVAQHFALAMVVEFGFPVEVQTAAAIERRMEQAS